MTKEEARKILQQKREENAAEQKEFYNKKKQETAAAEEEEKKAREEEQEKRKQVWEAEKQIIQEAQKTDDLSIAAWRNFQDKIKEKEKAEKEQEAAAEILKEKEQKRKQAKERENFWREVAEQAAEQASQEPTDEQAEKFAQEEAAKKAKRKAEEKEAEKYPEHDPDTQNAWDLLSRAAEILKIVVFDEGNEEAGHHLNGKAEDLEAAAEILRKAAQEFKHQWWMEANITEAGTRAAEEARNNTTQDDNQTPTEWAEETDLTQEEKEAAAEWARAAKRKAEKEDDYEEAADNFNHAKADAEQDDLELDAESQDEVWLPNTEFLQDAADAAEEATDAWYAWKEAQEEWDEAEANLRFLADNHAAEESTKHHPETEEGKKWLEEAAEARRNKLHEAAEEQANFY